MSRSKSLCGYCGATPGGCESLHLLGGRRCCERCRGHHDLTTTEHHHHEGKNR